jgi:hypothetical protein
MSAFKSLRLFLQKTPQNLIVLLARHVQVELRLRQERA